MSKNKSLSALDIFRTPATIEREVAAKYYFSGELEELRKLAVSRGDRPWRILRYQRTITPEDVGYPIGKLSYTRPDTLEQHLKYLIKNCTVVSLPKLLSQLAAGETPADKTVALTFDGGWIDNFVYAYPLLLRYQVPATMFLPTAFIGTKNYFWEDKILFALTIMMQAGLPFIPFDFFDEGEIEALKRVSPTLEITLPLIFLIVATLTQKPLTDRIVALMALGNVAQQLGGDLPQAPAFMEWPDVQRLSRSAISIGSLTHGHVMPTEIETNDYRQDVQMSLETLKLHSIPPLSVMALPGGIITPDAATIAHGLGIGTLLVTAEGMLAADADDARPLIVGRTNVYEGASFCTELFACHLWLRHEGS